MPVARVQAGLSLFLGKYSYEVSHSWRIASLGPALHIGQVK